MLKFFWNGIKGSDGKMQFCSYSDGKLYGNFPDGTISIYASSSKGTVRFHGDVADSFDDIQNDTDSQTDYFESDRIRVVPSHPLYAAVKAAMDARQARFDAKYGKRAA